MVGLCCCSRAAKRVLPPAVVSPLILALMTLASILAESSWFSSKLTQPLPRAKPYSADKLSPSTSTVFDAEYAGIANTVSSHTSELSMQ